MIEKIEKARKECQREPFLLAIDGRCASGKTTYAALLSEKWHCPVFHIDDFFLQPEQRTAARLAEPGGNFDRERFLSEILLPLRERKNIRYRPWIAHPDAAYGKEIDIPAPKVAIIEGSYSLHPALRQFYDFRLFFTISQQEQLRRLAARSPARLAGFIETWIPLEETYFTACKVPVGADAVVDTTTAPPSI